MYLFLFVFPKMTCDNISIVIILVYFFVLYDYKLNILWFLNVGFNIKHFI